MKDPSSVTGKKGETSATSANLAKRLVIFAVNDD
jgi:hypothetical protein